MSISQQPRLSIRIGLPSAQCWILEEETGLSSFQLTADQASLPSPSVEAPALPKATPPSSEISALPEDPFPEDFAPLEKGSLPVDFIPTERNIPHEDSAPMEGRSPSLVPYEEEDEVTEA
ncbi:hypothetical protein P9112_014218 [Eukaryota sp. TZLM1-RC]